MFSIESRRYVGNKFKLSAWIKENILENCTNLESLFDVFAGTGVVTKSMSDVFSMFYLNDFLYSNEVIYKGFFGNQKYRNDVLSKLKLFFEQLNPDELPDNYVSNNYGGKFFSPSDAKKIGFIRQYIEDLNNSGELIGKEYYILLSSLLYSLDRAANTVGHYEAYIKSKGVRSRFAFDLIAPINMNGKNVNIFRQDSNALARSVHASLAFIDPPYNSRQYSRFYHVLETITKWDFPDLYGVAMKPVEDNMSDYCRNNAPMVFDDLIKNLDVRYIVVTYNNTYKSKSSSSQNKISLEQISDILEKRGVTKVFEKPYRFFNSGKTEFADHKEMLFITEIK